jgi:predicted AAA+ superfamily ATPase
MPLRVFDAVPTMAVLRVGRLFEQWIVQECWRLLDYLDVEARLFYWRTHIGAEVDLLIERHTAEQRVNPRFDLLLVGSLGADS